jgi:hypothetical protein
MSMIAKVKSVLRKIYDNIIGILKIGVRINNINLKLDILSKQVQWLCDYNRISTDITHPFPPEPKHIPLRLRQRAQRMRQKKHGILRRSVTWSIML